MRDHEVLVWNAARSSAEVQRRSTPLDVLPRLAARSARIRALYSFPRFINSAAVDGRPLGLVGLSCSLSTAFSSFVKILNACS